MLNLQLYYARPTRQRRHVRRPRCRRLRRGHDGAGGPHSTSRPGPPRGRPTAATAACPIRRRSGPTMIQIGTEGGILPAPVVLPNTPVGYDYNRRDIIVLNVTQQDAVPRPGRARRRHRRLLAGARRLEAHPLQRRARAGPGVRPAQRLLHGRPGPDRRPAARRRRCPATAPTPARSCSSRWRGAARGRRSTSPRCRRRCRRPTRRRRPRRSCREAAYNTAFGTTFPDTYVAHPGHAR